MDPISDQFPHVSVYNYAENKPINSIDLWGLQSYPMYGPNNPQYGFNKDITKGAQKFAKENPVAATAILAAPFAGALAIEAGGAATLGFIANEVKDEVLSQATGGLSDFADLSKMAVKGVKKLASSLDDVVGNLKSGSESLKNVDVLKDDDFMQVRAEFDGEQIGMQGTFSVDEGVMTIKGVDYEGEIGVMQIRKLMKEFGSASGVKKIEIHPGKRTTGADPGKTPKPFTINIDE